jgi:hypothetical protein
MDALPRAFLATIMAIPFGAAALLFVLAMRAVIRGQLISKGRYLPARTILRSAQPIQFWLEVALYCVCGMFLLLMGLMWVGHDPRWFHQMMLSNAKAAHGPR